MERIVGNAAIFDIFDRGSEYDIDVGTMLPMYAKADVKFDDNYLEKIIRKYYGKVN
jgi:Ca2+-binding EF-hand superfamily protein